MRRLGPTLILLALMLGGMAMRDASAQDATPPPTMKHRVRAQGRKGEVVRNERFAVLYHPSRPVQDLGRDAASRPLEVFQWLGVHPGAMVADLRPGDGYYTHLLALVVGGSGKVTAVAGPAGKDQPPGRDRLLQRVTDAPLSNVRLVDSPSALEPESMDLVFVDGDLPEGDFLRPLKPGGVLGILPAASEGKTRRDLVALGFEFLSRSDILRQKLEPGVPERSLLMFRRKPAPGTEPQGGP